MKAILDSRTLSRHIELASGGCADRRSPTSKYHGVMVKANGQQAVQIYAERNNCGCVVQADADVIDSAGEMYLDPVKAVAYLKPYQESGLPCTLRDPGVLAIGSGELSFTEHSAYGFQLATAVNWEWLGSLVATEACAAFDLASMVCKEKDNGHARYFAIALCSGGENSIDVVGTDARRMAHVELKNACSSAVLGCANDGLRNPMVLHRTFVRKTLLPLLKSSGDQEVWFGRSSRNCFVFQDRINNWTAWVCDSIDRYVEWRSAIPSPTYYRAMMAAADLYNACHMASQMPAGITRVVSFEFGEETLAIFGSNNYTGLDSRSPLATAAVLKSTDSDTAGQLKFQADPQLFCDVLKTIGGRRSKLMLLLEKGSHANSSVLLTIHGWGLPCRFVIATANLL